MKLLFSLVLAVGLVAIVGLVAASGDPHSPNYRDPMVEALELIYSTDKQPEVGYLKLEAALNTVIFTLNNYQSDEGYLPAELHRIRTEAKILTDACTLKASACELVLDDLESLKRKLANELPGSKNRLAYVNVCHERQKTFCSNPTAQQETESKPESRKKKRKLNLNLAKMVGLVSHSKSSQ